MSNKVKNFRKQEVVNAVPMSKTMNTCKRAWDLRQNTRPVEYFCIQVGQISHNENENWLNHANVVGESCHQAGKETPYDTYQAKGD